MESTLAVINALENEGIISRYAIGGAIAATFYTEPIATFDLDVFVVLPESQGGLISLAPVYEKLRARGYFEKGECVMIEGLAVQFLPTYNKLIEEALTAARDTQLGGTPTRILTAEHLAAIMVDTGPEKDRQRLEMFLRMRVLDLSKLRDIIGRHGLAEKWNKMKQ